VASAQNWTRVAVELERSLAQPIPKAKRHLLPKILREWARTDLRDHLSREPRATTLERIKKLESVRDLARDLQGALHAIKDDTAALVAQIFMTRGQRPHEFNQADFRQKFAELDQYSQFVTDLTNIKPREFWKLRRGQPRNVKAYLVLQDVAAIYEWATGKPATREVDREDGSEVSPFFKFASILWPPIFGNGVAGLKAATKNWAAWRKKHDERSFLIRNIALRHPEWGLSGHKQPIPPM
jgi:hypothetical protein